MLAIKSPKKKASLNFERDEIKSWLSCCPRPSIDFMTNSEKNIDNRQDEQIFTVAKPPIKLMDHLHTDVKIFSNFSYLSYISFEQINLSLSRLIRR